MRRIFLFATGLFWLLLLAIWLGSRYAAPVPAVSPARALAGYTLAQVAQHARPEDCWMAIDGAVYDLAAYLPEHPARSGVIEEWCGKEASQAYRTKLRDRPHSPQADRLLIQYRIGVLLRP